MKKHLFTTLIGLFAFQFVSALAAENLNVEIRYITFNDSSIVAIPENLILEEKNENNKATLLLDGGEVFVYAYDEVCNVSNNYNNTPLTLMSFSFTHEDNDQVYADVEAIINDDGEVIDVTADVPVIGKRLRPSFSVSDGAALYVNGEKQISGFSSHRFEDQVTYTLAKLNHVIYDAVEGFIPFGRTCNVKVKYLTDYATGVYKIPTIYLTFGDGETWSDSQWIGQTLPDGTNTKEEWIEECTFRLDGAGIWPDIDTVEGCEIRGRGNSSWSWNSYSKNPYRIKFPKKQKQSPFNLTKDRQWVFIANKKSGSMTTNSIAQKIASMVDAEAICHMIPIDLYINGHYRGSYCFTEKIGIADNSVAINETTGCLLELDDYFDEHYKFRDETYNLPVNVKDPDFTEEDDERIVTFDDIKESFNSMTEALFNGDDISKYVDMDTWAKFWLVNDLVRNVETYHPKSCYIFNENPVNGDKWKLGPVWDFDWAFGYEDSGNYFIEGADEDLFSNRSGKSGFCFYDDLRNSEAGKRAYVKEWDDFMKEGRLQELIEYIDDYTEFTKSSFGHNNDASISERDYNDYSEIANRSKAWLTNRVSYIYNNLDRDFIDTPDEEFPEHRINLIYAEDTETYAGSEVILPILMDNTEDIISYEFELELPQGVSVQKNENGKYLISTGRSSSHQILTKTSAEGNIVVSAYSMSNEVLTGESGAVAYITLHIAGDVAYGNHTITLKNIVMTRTDITGHNIPYTESILTIRQCVLGDVNNDGQINITDVSGVISLWLGNAPSYIIRKAADINSDNQINVVDISGVIELFLTANNSRKADTEIKYDVNEKVFYGVYPATLNVKNGEYVELPIILSNLGTDIVSAEFDLYLPSGIELAQDESFGIASGFVMYDHQIITKKNNDGSIKIAIFSLTNSSFSSNIGELVTFRLKSTNSLSAGNYEVWVKNQIFVTSEMQILTSNNCKSTINVDTETSINNAKESTGFIRVYDLQGRRTNKIQHGVYIVNNKKIIK